MTPIDAFKRAVFWVSSLSSRIYADKPGAVIERMSEKERDALKDLKSSDVEGQLMNDWDKYTLGGRQYDLEKHFEEAKLDFDKKVLKK